MSAQHWKACPCPICTRRRDERRFRIIIAVLVLTFLALCVMIQCGCASTITPAAVESHQASFDQGEQNSGVIALIPGGAIITPRARDRWNGLIAIYGRDINPPIQTDYGLAAVAQQTDAQTPGGEHAATVQYTITAEALQKFILLNQWHRMGRLPGGLTKKNK